MRVKYFRSCRWYEKSPGIGAFLRVKYSGADNVRHYAAAYCILFRCRARGCIREKTLPAPLTVRQLSEGFCFSLLVPVIACCYEIEYALEYIGFAGQSQDLYFLLFLVYQFAGHMIDMHGNHLDEK